MPVRPCVAIDNPVRLRVRGCHNDASGRITQPYIDFQRHVHTSGTCGANNAIEVLASFPRAGLLLLAQIGQNVAARLVEFDVFRSLHNADQHNLASRTPRSSAASSAGPSNAEPSYGTSNRAFVGENGADGSRPGRSYTAKTGTLLLARTSSVTLP